MQISRLTSALLLTILSVDASFGESVDPKSRPASLRRGPSAIAARNETIWISNQVSGSIFRVHSKTRQILSETPVGKSLQDIALVPGQPLIVAVDGGAHELLLLHRETLKVLSRLPVAKYPVRVAMTNDGKRIVVTSLWSRRLTLVDLNFSGTSDAGFSLSKFRTIDLDFAPREICLLPPVSIEGVDREQFVIADAFGGRLVVVDANDGNTVGAPTIAGHHLHGMSLHPSTSTAGRSLLVSHQVLNSETSTTHEHVFWGGVIGNRLRSLALPELTAPPRKEPAPGSVDVLGRPSAAAGDPSGLAVSSHGTTIVALSGVNEVAIRRRPEDVFTEIAVGRRPTRVLLLPEEKEAVVINSLDDSLSFIDIDNLKVAATVPLREESEPTFAERGERLFYDSRLSLDGWYSCHSCHTDGHTNGLLNDNLGDEYFGAPKKILSLLGTGETAPWAWNGGSVSLEAQIAKSLRVTMQSEEADANEENVRAIKSYLLTLSPPPGIDTARENWDAKLIFGGKKVFRAEGCVECHAPETYTTGGRFDVGIHDERGMKEFNPPSLRGVSQRAPFFHDNRARNLEEVIDRFRHGQKSKLSPEDRLALLAFLRSL